MDEEEIAFVPHRWMELSTITWPMESDSSCLSQCGVTSLPALAYILRRNYSAHTGNRLFPQNTQNINRNRHTSESLIQGVKVVATKASLYSPDPKSGRCPLFSKGLRSLRLLRNIHAPDRPRSRSVFDYRTDYGRGPRD